MKKKNQEKRLGFNFLLSYYEVFKRLPDAESKEKFITAVCDKQFFGKNPKLDGIVEFAYASQKHSIDKSRKGWDDSLKKEKINNDEESNNQSVKSAPPEGYPQGPLAHPLKGPYEGPSVQEKEEEKEEEKVKQKEEQEDEEEIKRKIRNKEKVIIKNKNDVLIYLDDVRETYPLDDTRVNDYLMELLSSPENREVHLVDDLLKCSKF